MIARGGVWGGGGEGASEGVGWVRGDEVLKVMCAGEGWGGLG